jgi:hypothetical protein
MARDSEKLDLILEKIDAMDRRLISVERKLDVVALTLLAPEECASLGIGKKPTTPRRGGGSPSSSSGDSAPVPMAAKPR